MPSGISYDDTERVLTLDTTNTEVPGEVEVPNFFIEETEENIELAKDVLDALDTAAADRADAAAAVNHEIAKCVKSDMNITASDLRFAHSMHNMDPKKRARRLMSVAFLWKVWGTDVPQMDMFGTKND